MKDNQRFNKYLNLLGLEERTPSYEYLCEIVSSQLTRVPFENISKIYYRKKYNLRTLIDFDLHLDGIKCYNFGGTCYANNYYLNRLLRYLGFEVELCGANMTEPDVHVINIVRLESKKFLVDVGYGAPFDFPLPLDLNNDIEIKQGNEKYVLKTKDNNNVSAVEHYCDSKLVHGYRINPTVRKIDYFKRVIADSFNDKSMFMTNVRAIRFHKDHTTSLRNLSLTTYYGSTYQTKEISDTKALVKTIVEHFDMPEEIVRYVVMDISNL